MTQDTPTDRFRLVAVNLDEASIGRSSPDIDHERADAAHVGLVRAARRGTAHHRTDARE